ncbi:RHS repeat-associated core domain-containing protein [Luteibacter anthropi]|uniref:RHS repeat-associated core domain-containing protein n=1 Tax=Luteibacter anthropi TaxID=564369 RepID=A0A7X5ZIY4_9GAMM|nr:RHS repeat-associated core domain-containing protein [Luteibacter anthropi]NII07398.1 RHS repeat-associated core domain-containing protein [Luteibacter anthropi]
MGEVFGADAPQEDPDKDGQAYVLDMRFPGQRYDRYTGLFQNWYRDYDPASGRYVQSDPIGLMAGVSTYSYAHSSSLSTSDRLGLDDSQCMFNREACGWPSPVQKHTNASFGIGETGAAALAIQSSEFGIAFDSTPNMCFYATVCGSVGTGIGAGGAVGITASLGTGALSSGQNDTAQFGFDTGDVAVGGATVQYDPMGKQIAVARGFAGVGAGVWAGAMTCTSHYYCARQDSSSNCK